ncbi:hypothetical protein QOT17_024850 [Balamuthia mandrillaris]
MEPSSSPVLDALRRQFGEDGKAANASTSPNMKKEQTVKILNEITPKFNKERYMERQSAAFESLDDIISSLRGSEAPSPRSSPLWKSSPNFNPKKNEQPKIEGEEEEEDEVHSLIVRASMQIDARTAQLALAQGGNLSDDSRSSSPLSSATNSLRSSSKSKSPPSRTQSDRGTQKKEKEKEEEGKSDGGEDQAEAEEDDEDDEGEEYPELTIYNSLEVPSCYQHACYEYLHYTDTPFSFPKEAQTQKQEEAPEEFSLEDYELEDGMEEPKDGMLPSFFDPEEYKAAREAIVSLDYVPHLFARQLSAFRGPEHYSSKEKLEGFSNIGFANTSKTTYLSIIDENLDKKQLKQLGKKISQYDNVEACIIKGVKPLAKVDDIKLPQLRYLDLSDCNISSLRSLIAMLRHSPNLEELVVAGNPVASAPDLREKVIGTCGYIRVIDGAAVAIDERVEAIAKHGSKEQKKNIQLIRWDWVFCDLPDIRRMAEWEPTKLTNLVINNAQLEVFHVGSMPCLQVLNLRDNQISDVQGSGIEQCEQLWSIDLSNNAIVKTTSLSAFAYVPNLKELYLAGNKDGTKVLSESEYRPLVIAVTCELKGYNHAPGLRSLDGKLISLEERIEAFERIKSKKRKISIGEYRWETYLIDYCGHLQIRTPEYANRLRHLMLPSCQFTSVDLSPFTSLELLDLSGNFLTKVEGLEALSHLKFLNLSGNVKLNLVDTLERLAKAKTLQQVSFCLTVKGHKRHPDNKKYRQTVLQALLHRNEKLRWLDNQWIALEERVEAFANSTKAKKADVDKYRFHIALLDNILEPKAITTYKASKIHVGCSLYDADQVTSLLGLCNHSLVNEALDFSAFSRLRELNLSRNKLTSFSAKEGLGGLELLPSLRVLDLSSNNIKSSLKEECICLRDNPVMKGKDARTKLITLLPKMKEITYPLRVIDTEISITERVDILKNAGIISEQQGAELLKNAILFQRVPPNINIYTSERSKLCALNLSMSMLYEIDLSPYVNLEVVLLRHNKLQHLAGTGIDSLKRLRVLDLRDNLLGSMEEVVVSAVSVLPGLTALGIEGNKFSPRETSSTWRKQFLALIPDFHKKHYRLQYLDEALITPQEIVLAFDITAENAVFEVALMRQMKGVAKLAMEELDLANCQLSHAPLSPFQNLSSLNLANNKIESIKEVNIAKMTKLTSLDVSNNKLGDLSELAATITKLKSLSQVTVIGNPCFPEDTTEHRSQLLSLLLQSADPLNFTLKSLNRSPVSTIDICTSLAESKDVDVQAIRLQLCLRAQQLKPSDPTSIVSLDLSAKGFVGLDGLQNFVNLTRLDLQRNSLITIETTIFRHLAQLSYLDLRENDLQEGVGKISKALAHCPSLSVLFLKNATNDKKRTCSPKNYAHKVFSLLPYLQILDNLRNPFGSPLSWFPPTRPSEQAQQQLTPDKAKEKAEEAEEDVKTTTTKQGRPTTGKSKRGYSVATMKLHRTKAQEVAKAQQQLEEGDAALSQTNNDAAEGEAVIAADGEKEQP